MKVIAAFAERLRDILECIEAIDRAEVTVARYPGDPDVARIALDAVQGRVFTDRGGRQGLIAGSASALPGRTLVRHGPYARPDRSSLLQARSPDRSRHHRCARRTASGRVQSDPCGTRRGG